MNPETESNEPVTEAAEDAAVEEAAAEATEESASTEMSVEDFAALDSDDGLNIGQEQVQSPSVSFRGNRPLLVPRSRRHAPRSPFPGGAPTPSATPPVSSPPP